MLFPAPAELETGKLLRCLGIRLGMSAGMDNNNDEVRDTALARISKHRSPSTDLLAPISMHRGSGGPDQGLGHVVILDPLRSVRRQPWPGGAVGSGLSWDHLGAMLAWGLAGLIVVAWRFSSVNLEPSRRRLPAKAGVAPTAKGRE
jgi:hypothetical protein